MRRIILAAALLGGCASIEKPFLTRESTFQPLPDGFAFTSKASTNLQEDSQAAEKVRRQIMAEFVERNGVCPSGYVVAERTVIRRPKTALGVSTLADIIYKGRCR